MVLTVRSGRLRLDRQREQYAMFAALRTTRRRKRPQAPHTAGGPDVWSSAGLVVWRSRRPWSHGPHSTPRTANSTAPTSTIPNVYGPQYDRTAKTTPAPPPSRWPSCLVVL